MLGVLPAESFAHDRGLKFLVFEQAPLRGQEHGQIKHGGREASGIRGRAAARG